MTTGRPVTAIVENVAIFNTSYELVLPIRHFRKQPTSHAANLDKHGFENDDHANDETN
jgi:hypothetical protein